MRWNTVSCMCALAFRLPIGRRPVSRYCSILNALSGVSSLWYIRVLFLYNGRTWVFATHTEAQGSSTISLSLLHWKRISSGGCINYPLRTEWNSKNPIVMVSIVGTRGKLIKALNNVWAVATEVHLGHNQASRKRSIPLTRSNGRDLITLHGEIYNDGKSLGRDRSRTLSADRLRSISLDHV